MSWFTSVFGLVLRLFGWGKPKDRKIPAPLLGSDLMRLDSDGSTRAEEAVSVIRGFVRPPYQLHDRELRIASVSWDDGRAFFARYGYDPYVWNKTREGNFYAPKPGILDAGLIHLVEKDLDQPRRVFLALHEVSHAIYHWLLTAEEWREIGMRNWTYEEFADDLTRRLLGEKLDSRKTAFFEALEKRLTETGTKAQRL